MKTRHGFVANSSSSSFCIMGVYIGDGDDTSNLGEEAYNELQGTELEVEFGCMAYDDSVYVGLSVEKMGDNETKLQFQERVIKGLRGTKYENKIPKVRWITDGGYNG